MSVTGPWRTRRSQPCGDLGLPGSKRIPSCSGSEQARAEQDPAPYKAAGDPLGSPRMPVLSSHQARIKAKVLLRGHQALRGPCLKYCRPCSYLRAFAQPPRLPGPASFPADRVDCSSSLSLCSVPATCGWRPSCSPPRPWSLGWPELNERRMLISPHRALQDRSALLGRTPLDAHCVPDAMGRWRQSPLLKVLPGPCEHWGAGAAQDPGHALLPQEPEGWGGVLGG